MEKVEFEIELNGYRIYGDEKSVCFDSLVVDSNDCVEYTWAEILHWATRGV